ncbi:hypothetical protein K440DRAFT_663188 [Wilcoxina mikolae CBS 423.85]|nr:hypothetical protein K440DRAFT_663188 [Wilcoxina mikolae CBS 423.85]
MKAISPSQTSTTTTHQLSGMHFSILLTTVFLPLAFAIPNSGSNSFGETAYLRAIKRGIDPHGPRPNDFLSHNGRSVEFAEGSAYALWAAAQSGLKKRGTTTGVDITPVNNRQYFSVSQANHGRPPYTARITFNYYSKATGECYFDSPSETYVDNGDGLSEWYKIEAPKSRAELHSNSATLTTLKPRPQFDMFSLWHLLRHHRTSVPKRSDRPPSDL